jgi:hypothetical protein
MPNKPGGSVLAEVIEPETTCPARYDPCTRHQLATARRELAWAALWALLAAAGAVTITAALPGVGNLAAAVVLGLWALLNLAWLVGLRRQYRFLRSPALDRPWRPLPAATVKRRHKLFRIVVDTESGPLVLAELNDDHARIVQARGRIWLCGTDRRFAVVRCDGKVDAKALTILDEPVPDAEEIAAREVPPDSPAEDPAVLQLRRESIVGFWGQWAAGLVGMLLGAGVIALSVAPFQLAGVVAGAIVVFGGLVASLQRQPKDARRAIELLTTATHWTPLTIQRNRQAVLPRYSVQHGDRKLWVTLHEVDRDLEASITATGTLWVAGDPDGEAAIGLPGYPATGLARFGAWPTLD